MSPLNVKTLNTSTENLQVLLACILTTRTQIEADIQNSEDKLMYMDFMNKLKQCEQDVGRAICG